MMAQESPLRQRHEDAGAQMLFFGADASGGETAARAGEADDTTPAGPPTGALVPDTFGSVESEYAAIRKGCVLLDLPHRGAVVVRGGERIDFLNNMLTQELKPGGTALPPYHNAESFWLNRKGRIDADLRLTQLPGDGPPAGGGAEALTDDGGLIAGGMWFDLDVMAAASAAESLGAFIFSEDAEVIDATASTHRFALHGPASARLAGDVSEADPDHPDAPDPSELRNGQSTVRRIAGRRVLIDRRDETGEIGLHVLCALPHATAVFDAFARHARDDFGHHNDPATDTYKLRHAGWAAYNVARIEAGTPVFRVDFGPTNLPAESGLLGRRVSFTKGCYLGQEVVARMHSLGKPKQTLVTLRMALPASGDLSESDLPATGSAVFKSDADVLTLESETPPKPIGGVTSATRSPMLGGAAIALAQVKWGSHEPGTTLLVQTGAGVAKATVNEGLAVWKR
jgi:folate-binding protein YgfZ